MIEKRSFERKNEFWISGKADASQGISADVWLPIGETELHIVGNELRVSHTEGVLCNGKPIKSNLVWLEKGDQITVGSYNLVFYEKLLEITGNPEEKNGKHWTTRTHFQMHWRIWCFTTAAVCMKEAFWMMIFFR